MSARLTPFTTRYLTTYSPQGGLKGPRKLLWEILLLAPKKRKKLVGLRIIQAMKYEKSRSLRAVTLLFKFQNHFSDERSLGGLFGANKVKGECSIPSKSQKFRSYWKNLLSFLNYKNSRPATWEIYLIWYTWYSIRIFHFLSCFRVSIFSVLLSNGMTERILYSSVFIRYQIPKLLTFLY